MICLELRNMNGIIRGRCDGRVRGKRRGEGAI